MKNDLLKETDAFLKVKDDVPLAQGRGNFEAVSLDSEPDVPGLIKEIAPSANQATKVVSPSPEGYESEGSLF
jgi:hypothetical protein